jgi:hypothetical protein
MAQYSELILSPAAAMFVVVLLPASVAGKTQFHIFKK